MQVGELPQRACLGVWNSGGLYDSNDSGAVVYSGAVDTAGCSPMQDTLYL